MSFSASPITPSNRQFTDTNGVPLAGGSVSYYSPATLVAKTTWIDENQITPNPTTITLDSAGRATVFGSGDYRELVKDINGNTILDTTTNVPVASTGVVSGTQIITIGNIISGAWTTAGIREILNTATYTDTTSAGTVAAVYIDLHGNGVVATNNVVTFTAAYGAFFQTPTAGTNTTFTKAYGLGADAAFITALTATTVNKLTLTTPATGSTLTIADGKTFTVNQTLTLTGTTGTTMTFPATSATIARTDAANTFTGHQTIEGVTSTGATGTGNLVFSIAPTLTGNVIFTGSWGDAINAPYGMTAGHIAQITGSNASNYQLITQTTAASGTSYVQQFLFQAFTPNSTTSLFWSCDDTTGNKAQMRSNGGLANFSANNVNLSDISVKPVFERYPAGILDQLQSAFISVDWGRFKYADQTHSDWNHGYSAQGVEAAFAGIAPELVDNSWPGKDGKLKAVYHEDLKNISMALLARALTRIAALEAKAGSSAKP